VNHNEILTPGLTVPIMNFSNSSLPSCRSESQKKIQTKSTHSSAIEGEDATMF
jgi:hypothetical protein